MTNIKATEGFEAGVSGIDFNRHVGRDDVQNFESKHGNLNFVAGIMPPDVSYDVEGPSQGPSLDNDSYDNTPEHAPRPGGFPG